MSFKRSNASSSDNSLKAKCLTKVPKRYASLKHTPLTVGLENDGPERLENSCEIDDFKQPLSCYLIKTSNALCTRSSDHSPVFSKCQKSNFGRLGLHKRKIKAMESADGSVNYASATEEFSDNIPSELNIRKPSQYYHPVGPTLLSSYSTKSAEELNVLLMSTNYRDKSSIFQSSKNPTETNSEQSVGSEGKRNVKSILKNSLDKSHESVCFRKKVRFDLGSESPIPKAFRDLYTPLKTNDYGDHDSFSSNTNLLIPEKDVTTVKDNSSQNNLNKMSPCTLPDNFMSNKANVFEDVSCLDLKNVNAEPDNENVGAVTISHDSNKNTPLRNDICLNPSKKGNLSENEMKQAGSESLGNKLSNNDLRTTFRSSKPKKTIKKPAKKLNPEIPHSLPKIDVLSSIDLPSKITNGKIILEKSGNTSKKEESNSQSPVNTNEEDHLSTLHLDNLLNCTKKELLEFLRSLSSAISLRDDSKAVSKAMLRGFLEDLRTKQDENCSPPETQQMEKRIPSPTTHKENVENVKPITEESILDVDKIVCASGPCSLNSSSVTSVSSLLSTISSLEQNISDTNTKSIRFLHRCLEETFCNDNMNENDKSNIKTEYKNYSLSSSDSKKSIDFLLNNTLLKLTSILEDLNTKIDKLASAEENRIYGKMPLDSLVMTTSGGLKEENMMHNSAICLPKYELRERTASNMFETTYRDESSLKNDEDSLNVVNPTMSHKEERNGAYALSNFNQTNGVMSLRQRPQRIGFSRKSQSENEIVIRLIDESVAINKKIKMTFMFPPFSETSPEISDNKINENFVGLPNQNQDNGKILLKPLPHDSEPFNINSADIQSILKQINEKINSVKLNGPTMYESVGKPNKEHRHKSSVSIKDISQTVQKSFNGFFQSLCKHIPNKDVIKSKLVRKRSRSIFSNSSTKETIDGGNPFFESLKHFLPFCRPSEESDDELQKLNDHKHLERHSQNGIQTDKDDETETNGSCEGWPDLRRTRYPNGTIYYGPLARMPEPEICLSGSNAEIPLLQYTSDLSSQTCNKTVYRKSLSQKFTLSESDLHRRVRASYEKISLEHTVTNHDYE